MTSKLTLIYFDIRGRAENARLILAEAGADYEDRRLPFQKGGENPEFVAMKPSLPYGQLPVLEVDGVQIAQSVAICRYLAKRYNLYGKSDVEAAMIDSIVDHQTDIGTANMVMHLRQSEDEKKKFVTEGLPSRLQYLENFLKKNGDYLTETFSYADIVVANRWFMLWSDYAEHMGGFPLLKAHYERVMARPNIAAYVAKRPQRNM